MNDQYPTPLAWSGTFKCGQMASVARMRTSRAGGQAGHHTQLLGLAGGGRESEVLATLLEL